MEKRKTNKKALDITYPAPYVTLENSAPSRANKRNNQMPQSPKPQVPQHLQSLNNTTSISKNFVVKNIKYSKALSDRNKLWKDIMANSCRSCTGCPRNPKRSESAAPHLKYGVFPKRKNPNRNQSMPIELFGRDTSNMSNMHRLAQSTIATIKRRRRDRQGEEEPPMYVYKPQNTESRVLSPTEVMHIDIKPTRDLRAPPKSSVSPVFNLLPPMPT